MHSIFVFLQQCVCLSAKKCSLFRGLSCVIADLASSNFLSFNLKMSSDTACLQVEICLGGMLFSTAASMILGGFFSLNVAFLFIIVQMHRSGRKSRCNSDSDMPGEGALLPSLLFFLFFSSSCLHEIGGFLVWTLYTHPSSKRLNLVAFYLPHSFVVHAWNLHVVGGICPDVLIWSREIRGNLISVCVFLRDRICIHFRENSF